MKLLNATTTIDNKRTDLEIKIIKWSKDDLNMPNFKLIVLFYSQEKGRRKQTDGFTTTLQLDELCVLTDNLNEFLENI